MKMSFKSLRSLSIAVFVALLATPARANVGLILSDGDATPGSTIVVPGSTFTVTASLVSTSESLTGVDYYLQATGAGTGKFRITGRNIASSPFSDLVKANVGDNGDNAGVLDSTMSLLNPRNGADLGASIANVNVPVTPGTYSLATYTFSVPSGTPAGTYVISTTSNSGTGWVATAPFFNEAEFASQGSFSVTVNTPITPVPEPAAAMLLAGVAGMLLRRR
jgi:hypothetical protein